MKHLKAFENFFTNTNETDFDLGSFDEPETNGEQKEENKMDPNQFDNNDCETCETDETNPTDVESTDDEPTTGVRKWGDEDTDMNGSSKRNVYHTNNDENSDENNTPYVENPVYVEKFNSFFEKKKLTKKEIAEIAPPKDKITQRDIIELKKKGGKVDKKKDEEKKPKFGSPEWQKKYGKKK